MPPGLGMPGPPLMLTHLFRALQACKYFLDGHKAAVDSVAFSSHDKQLASSWSDLPASLAQPPRPLPATHARLGAAA